GKPSAELVDPVPCCKPLSDREEVNNMTPLYTLLHSLPATLAIPRLPDRRHHALHRRYECQQQRLLAPPEMLAPCPRHTVLGLVAPAPHLLGGHAFMHLLKLSAVLLVLLALAFSAGQAGAETVGCQPITSVPVVITVQGIYCFTGHLNTAQTHGAAIEIAT